MIRGLFPQRTKKWVFICLCFVVVVPLEAQIVYEDLYTQNSFNNQSIDTSLPVGATAGSADVTNGSSSYIIPIQIPAGTNGVAPELSIAYNSQGGDGHLGIGWNITGLSAISRGLNTIYHDGESKGIALSSDDALLLDGMRLREVSAGVFKKEMDDYSTIEAMGSLGSKALWYRQETKYGVVIEYGKENNSVLAKTDGTEIILWRVSKIIYKDGNYISFHYTSTDRDSRITSIEYTGNDAAGLSPFAKISFSYADRESTSNTTYEAGSKIVRKYLLREITISSKSNPTGPFSIHKKYKFTYATDGINAFLKEVTETDGLDELNPTIFKYGDIPTQDFTYDGFSQFESLGNPTDIFTGDFNGDGLSDFLKAEIEYNNGHKYYSDFEVHTTELESSTVGLTFNYQFTKSLTDLGTITEYNAGYNFFSSDMTGEGRDDAVFAITKIIANSPYVSSVAVFEMNANATDATQETITIDVVDNDLFYDPGNRYMHLGDYNGDGVTDIILILSDIGLVTNTVYIYYGNESTEFEAISLVGTSHFDLNDWDVKNVNTIDYDGDGRNELMITGGLKSEIYRFNDLEATAVINQGFPTEWHLMWFGDFNGDRKTDILSRGDLNDTNEDWHIAIAKGDGTFDEDPFIWPTNKPIVDEDYLGNIISVADFNGDGRSDILRGNSVNTNTEVYYSRGDDFEDIILSTYTNIINRYGTQDMNGDGRSDLYIRGTTQGPADLLRLKSEGEDLLLEKIKNGHGHVSSFGYRNTARDTFVYERTEFTSHPINTVQPPMFLPYSLYKDGFRTSYYKYTDAKLHKEGKGFLGFAEIETSSGAPDMSEQMKYKLYDEQMVMLPDTIIKKHEDDIMHIRAITNTFYNSYDSNGDLETYRTHVTETDDENVFEGRWKVTSTTFDDYGNATFSSVDNNDLDGVTVTTVYEEFGTPIPAMPTSVTTNASRAGQPNYTTVEKHFYNGIGQVDSTIQFFGEEEALFTSYSYNSLGNRTATRIHANGEETRTSGSIFDWAGRYIETATNTLGQTSTSNYSIWGKPISTTGIDGLTTSYQYDGFGRLEKTTVPQGYDIDEVYDWDAGAAVYTRTTEHPGRPDVTTYHDNLDRVIQTDIEGFGLTKTSTATYDLRGNVQTSVSPTGFTTTTTYDDYNRPITIVDDFGTTSFVYSYSDIPETNGALHTETTNAAGQVSTKVTDASGYVVKSMDYGDTLTYEYYSHGNLKSVWNGTDTLVSTTFDEYARQTTLKDANAGLTTYEYDAFGQLISETTANNQTTTISYDKLGRMTERIGVEGTTTYTYYPTGSGASTNLLQNITSFGGDTESYTYDGFGRLEDFTHTIDGTAHLFSHTYDTYDNLETKTYPSGFGFKYHYDSNSYLERVTQLNGLNNFIEVTERNALDQLKKYKLRNLSPSTITVGYNHGIETSVNNSAAGTITNAWNFASGNLDSRSETYNGTTNTESFTYDNLNRLLTSSVTGQPTITQTYENNGNIDSKTDAGTDFNYISAKPHAVTQVISPDYNHLSIYTQQISYTPFIQPLMITERDNSLTFSYNSDHQRIKSHQQNSDGTEETRYYFGDYEKYEKDGVEREIHYLDIGRGINIVVEQRGGLTSYHEAFTDHLGSVVGMRKYFTNGTVSVLDKYNFDAWGRKRNATDWSYSTSASTYNWFNRGYTGHEHLDSFKLINMNGRLYDPILARMLSPDNNIQLPNYSQNYNRYSYALNNPLRFTDPDGEFIVSSLIGAGIGVLTNGLSNVANSSFNHHRGFFDGAGNAAAFGAVSGFVSSGIGMVAQTISSTPTFGKAAFQALAHGFSGAAINNIQGGDALQGFGSGFLSSVIGSGAQHLGAADAVVVVGGGMMGGVGARLVGGDFWNGFGRGLIVSGLNHVAHEIAEGIEGLLQGDPRRDPAIGMKQAIRRNVKRVLGMGSSPLVPAIETGIGVSSLHLSKRINYYNVGSPYLTQNGKTLFSKQLGRANFLRGVGTGLTALGLATSTVQTIQGQQHWGWLVGDVIFTAGATYGGLWGIGIYGAYSAGKVIYFKYFAD